MEPGLDQSRGASDRPDPQSVGWLAPSFAVLCAIFALMKSLQYHDQGQLRDEQMTTLLFAFGSLPCLGFTLFQMPRYRRAGRASLFAAVLACVITAACDALAVWNLTTALGGAKDRLF